MDHVTTRSYISEESHYYLGKQYQLKVNESSERMFYLNFNSLKEVVPLIHKRFSRSSEKAPPEQGCLSDEAELEALNPEPEVEAEEEIIITGPYQKRRGKRKPFPEHLPRVEIEHDLSEEEKVCPHNGTALKRIGEEVREQLDIIPTTIQVIRHFLPKYSCPCCENGVKVAPMPPQPIPKSMASPSLLA